MVSLYERITNLCSSKGISPSKMCVELGISKSTMSEMNAGRRHGVSTATAQKIADYFGVTVGYLLGTEDLETKKAPGEENLTEGEKTMLEIFRLIPPEWQQVFLDQGRAFANSLKKG